MEFRFEREVKARMFASILQQEVLFKSARSFCFLLFYLPYASVRGGDKTVWMRMLTQESDTDVIIPVCEGNESTAVP